MSAEVEYVPVGKDELPRNLRWTTPRRNQGQTVEVSYAQPGARDDADCGDLYQRVTDHSDRTVAYYKRA